MAIHECKGLNIFKNRLHTHRYLSTTEQGGGGNRKGKARHRALINQCPRKRNHLNCKEARLQTPIPEIIPAASSWVSPVHWEKQKTVVERRLIKTSLFFSTFFSSSTIDSSGRGDGYINRKSITIYKCHFERMSCTFIKAVRSGMRS